MTVDRLYRHLLQKLINATIDIDAYLVTAKGQRLLCRPAKMTICVITCLSFCREMCAGAAPAECHFTGGEWMSFRLAGESVAAAALCLMSAS